MVRRALWKYHESEFKVSLIKLKLINKVSLKLRSNYIFMHPYEYISLRKRQFLGYINRENIKHI